MMGLDILQAEILRHRWNSMACGCGNGDSSHVAEALTRISLAQTREEASMSGLDNHIFVQSAIYEAAYPAVQVALAALAAENISLHARRTYFDIVSIAVSDMDQGYGSRIKDLVGACRKAAAESMWVFYAELLSARDIASAAFAYETLDAVESDRKKLSYYHKVAGSLLPADLR